MNSNTLANENKISVSAFIKTTGFLKSAFAVMLVLVLVAYQLAIGRDFHLGMATAIVMCVIGAILSVKDRNHATLFFSGLGAAFLALNDPAQLLLQLPHLLQ